MNKAIIYYLFLFFLFFNNTNIFPQDFKSFISQDSGIEIELTQKGLDILSQQILEYGLEPIRDKQLPDIDKTIKWGINFKTEGNLLSLEFESLRLINQDGSIQLQLGIKNLDLYIRKFTASKTIFFPLTATCQNTRLKTEHNQLLFITTNIYGSIPDEQISLGLEEFNISMTPNQLQIEGPSHCSGGLIVAPIIKAIARNVLFQSKQSIISEIEESAQKINPYLEKYLNSFTHFDIDLNTLPFPNIARTKARLALKPAVLNIANDSFRIGFAGEFSQNDQKALFPLFHSINPILNLGKLGINPQLIEAFINHTIATNVDIIFDKNSTPAAHTLLEAEQAKKIWPELKNQPILDEHLRLKVHLSKGTEIDFTENGYFLSLNASKITFVVQILSGTEFKDFYEISMKLSGQINPKIMRNKFSLQPFKFTFSDWQGSFSSPSEIDDQNVSEDLLHTAIESMIRKLEDAPIFSLDLPTLNFAGHDINFVDLDLTPPLIHVKIATSDEEVNQLTLENFEFNHLNL